MNISNASSFVQNPSSTTAQECWRKIAGDIAFHPTVETPFFGLFIFDAVIEGISSLSAILGNTLLISAILTTPHLRTPSYYLIMSQAFSDLALALTVQPLCTSFLIFQLKTAYISHCLLWIIVVSISYYLSALSILSSTALSIDRFLAIHLRMRYKTTVTTYRIRIIVIAIYIFSLISSIVAHTTFEFKYKAIPVVVVGAICFVTIFSCYAFALKKLRNHMFDVGCQHQTENNPSSENTSSNLDLNKYKRSLWTLILIEVCFVIFATPAMVLWCYCMAYKVDENTISVLFTTGTLWRLTASINPAIHICRMRDLREASLAMLIRIKAFILSRILCS